MRIVFAGTPEFAARALDAILGAGHRVVGVLAQPDRPSGRRGLRVLPSAVKQRALAAALPVEQPQSLRDAGAQARLEPWFAKDNAELMVVAAYGLLLPPAVLAMPRLGCLNIHASLLPRWRGAAPIQRALLAGDITTGVCIMQMEAGLDTGPILRNKEIPILERDTTYSLGERLATTGAALVVEVLRDLPSGELPKYPQAAIGVTYASKITKAEAELDFNLGAIELDRRIRAFDREPGAVAWLHGTPIKLWSALPLTHPIRAAPPGTVRSCESGRLLIACGIDGRETLAVEELQKPGGKRMNTGQFLLGFALREGDRFGSSV